jgi:SAM-dependent methyltransferase
MAAPEPEDRVLEVGCGHGVLLDLLAGRLGSGSVLGLDRSATMTRAAQRRNAGAVTAGRVAVRTGDLLHADLGGAAFDLVVAVHVGDFWRPPAHEYGVVRRALADGGRLVLVTQPLEPQHAGAVAEQVSGLAAPHGLRVSAVHTGHTPPRPSIAVELRIAPERSSVADHGELAQHRG